MTQQQQIEQYDVSLKNTDVINMLQIIDASMTRGAWRAQEASAIGSIYEKLTSVLRKQDQDIVPVPNKSNTTE